MTALLAVLAVGCKVETQGLENIISPAPTYANFPGKRILAGQVSAAVRDWDGGIEGRVLASRANGEFFIVNPTTFESCSVGTVAAYLPFEYLTPFDAGLRPRVALLLTEGDDGRGELAFADWECNIWSTGLKRAQLSLRATVDGFLVSDASDQGQSLVLVNPWRQQVADVASNLASLWLSYDGWSFALEGPDLIVRDPGLSVALRLPDVALFLAFGGTHVVAQMKDASLRHVDVRSGETSVVLDDVCNLQGADLWDAPPYRAVSFVHPCEQGALWVYKRDDGNSWSLQRLGEQGQFASPRVVLDAYSDHEMLYVLDGAAAIPFTAPISRNRKSVRYSGALWGAPNLPMSGLLLKPEKIGERAVLPVLPSYSFLKRSGYPLILVDYDGTQGRLVTWEPRAAIRDVAMNVTELDGGLALVNWNGTSGDVLAAMQEPAVQLGLRVESLDVGQLEYADDGRIAVAFNTIEGDIKALRGSAAQWRTGLGLALETLAQGVPKGQYGWFSTDIFGFNRTDGNETGTLTIRFMDTLDTFEQKGVSRWQFFGVPPGILYFVDAGAKAGLWFAPLR